MRYGVRMVVGELCVMSVVGEARWMGAGSGRGASVLRAVVLLAQDGWTALMLAAREAHDEVSHCVDVALCPLSRLFTLNGEEVQHCPLHRCCVGERSKGVKALLSSQPKALEV